MQGNMQSILKTSSRFARSTSGNVAMMFSFAFVGIMAGIGLAVDLSHQSGAQASLQSSVDGVALSLARDAANLTPLQLTTKAQEQFDAAVSGTELKGLRVVATYQLTPTKALSLKVEGTLPSSFGAIFGINTLGLSAKTIVPMSSRPVQLALVMDNTGSMASRSKLTELKKAATNLIDAMEKASSASGNEIRISLVPFSRNVMVGQSNVNASWISWKNYNGQKKNWDGCVTDRDQPYDAKATLPSNDPSTLYPATTSCDQAQIMPLNSGWQNLKTRINEMTASGNTNLTIGLAWGLNMLTHGAPLSTASSDPGKYANYMIMLTDGLNTQNRWSTNSVSIDSRTLEACAQIKAAGIQLFTVRVIDGNANLLRTCASSPEMFYDVDDAAELTSVFDKISSSVKSAIYLSK